MHDSVGQLHALKNKPRKPGEASFFFHDHHFKYNAAKVLPGEYFVANEDIVIMTVLGSCIAACLWDSKLRIGGMNHFMLPEGGADTSGRYGSYAMELLINELMRLGARRERLQAKLFGGARMFNGLSDVGASNAAFAEKFMRDEAIPVLGTSLGGFGARRIQFWPTTGRAQQKTVTDNNDLARLKEVPKPAPAPVDDGGELELF